VRQCHCGAEGMGGWLCFRCLRSPGPPRTPGRVGTLRVCQLNLQIERCKSALARISWSRRCFPRFPLCVVTSPRPVDRIQRVGALRARAFYVPLLAQLPSQQSVVIEPGASLIHASMMLPLPSWPKARLLRALSSISRSCASLPTLGRGDDLTSVYTEGHLLLTRQLDDEFQLLAGRMH
jgi:hypothetical protein